MTYNEKFIAVIKSNGKILREQNQTVLLPFKSEFSILLKNLESRKCKIKVSIDGTDVLGGNSLILQPNTETELNGFLKENIVTNRFKFIQKTQQISDFIGDKIDDGIVRVEYWFEKYVVQNPIYWYNQPMVYPRQDHWYYNNIGGGCSGDVYGSAGTVTTSHSRDAIGKNINFNSEANSTGKITTCCFSSQNLRSVKENHDEGITVKGSPINEQYSYSYIGNLEDTSHVIILKLKGQTNNGDIIEKCVDVKTKKICPTCGTRSKYYVRYCGNCGTCLV